MNSLPDGYLNRLIKTVNMNTLKLEEHDKKLELLTLLLQKSEKRLDVLEQKIESIEEKVSKMDVVLSNLNDNFILWRRQEVSIQEQTCLNFVYFLLEKKYSTLKIKHLGELYHPTGKQILTEVDGCILLETHGTNQHSNYPRYRNNKMTINPLFRFNEAIIIEAKHTLDKRKVDKKLEQIYIFYTILLDIQKYGKSKYTEQFKTIIDNQSLQNFPLSINLIFASDTISHVLRNYISHIFDGMTKEQYDKDCFTMFREDPLFEKLRTDNKLPTKLKNAIKEITALDQLEPFFLDPRLNKYLSLFYSYRTRFEDLQKYFNYFKGNIGIVQFERVLFPKFFDSVEAFSF